MDLNLKNRSAFVCGSTQGIGKATAIELAKLGANITLIARNEQALQEVREELSSEYGQSHDCIVADFNQPEQLKTAVSNYLSNEKLIHILVNNSGGPAGGPIINASEEEFTSAFQRHLVCNQILAQALVPGMKKAEYGRIINIISTSVKIPIPGLGVSNTIRGAVASWSKTLAGELGSYGITVNNVLPGFMDTARLKSLFESKAKKTGTTYQKVLDTAISSIPAGRIGNAEEMAAAIAFLASPSAAYVNGINLPVDGGRTGTL